VLPDRPESYRWSKGVVGHVGGSLSPIRAEGLQLGCKEQVAEGFPNECSRELDR
jgi:hypothetical protein